MAPSGPSVSKSYLNSCLIASESYLMASDSTCVACKTSFVAQFIESSEIGDVWKHKHLMFDQAFTHFSIKSSRNNGCIRVTTFWEIAYSVGTFVFSILSICDFGYFPFWNWRADIFIAAQYLCSLLIKLYLGSFDQIDGSFAYQSWGFQWTCNALCM